MQDGVAAARRGVGREALRFAAAGRRFPDLQRAGRRRPCHRDRRARRPRRSTRCRSLKGASGRLELVGDASERRAGLRRLCAHARRAGECAAGAPPACRRAARRRVRRGRRPRPRQAPADGRGGGAATPTGSIVTDDNPRSEDPAAIRKAVLGGAPKAEEIGDRREAIRAAVAGLCSEATSCSSPARATRPARRSATRCCRSPTRRRRARALAERRRRGVSALWTTDAFVAAAGGRLEGDAPAGDRRHLDRQPHASRRATPSSPSAATLATATTSSTPRSQAGAALALVQRGARRRSGAGRCSSCPDDPLAALERVGAAARARMRGAVIAVTGSVGKTGTKEMLRLALSARRPDACAGRLVQQPLGRAADARAHAGGDGATASSRSA